MNKSIEERYDRLTATYPFPVEVIENNGHIIITSSIYLMENLVKEFGAETIWYSESMGGLIID